MLNAYRYFHTLRYLRPIQIYGRLWHKLYHPKPDLSTSPAIRLFSGAWRAPARKLPSLIGPTKFRFLNAEHDILTASAWNDTNCSKLWLYNLHYFDDLTADNESVRSAWHRSLIMRWIAENPPGIGVGWESYPLSLRIVNWIKWVFSSNTLPRAALESLAIQTRFLAKRMEFHLLGNHLFANAKALVFAGFFFEGKEADAWLDKGLQILADEISEQILEDGGHFERSPMYHSIILEDLLDLINLMHYYPDKLVEWGDIADHQQCCTQYQKSALYGASTLIEVVNRMIAWLKVMCHPDGQIALFNDAAFGIASQPAALYDYAERLGIHEPDRSMTEQPPLLQSSIDCFSFGHIRLTHLKTSGYIRVENGPTTVMLDVAPIGPDYLPGHAHADTLSFELSLGRQRVIVDSGVSQYGEGPERLRQRGTGAHNTVEIDEQDSSEVWGGFRVARRAYPRDVRIDAAEGVVSCAHDGYQRLSGQPKHCREWRFHKGGLQIHDEITGSFRKAVGRFHFHPDVRLIPASDSSDIAACDAGQILLPDSRELHWKIKKGCGRLCDTTWHPEFGLSIPNQCLEIGFTERETIINFRFIR
jgi:uncharacterized heparinase superfamily protein